MNRLTPADKISLGIVVLLCVFLIGKMQLANGQRARAAGRPVPARPVLIVAPGRYEVTDIQRPHLSFRVVLLKNEDGGTVSVPLRDGSPEAGEWETVRPGDRIEVRGSRPAKRLPDAVEDLVRDAGRAAEDPGR